MYSALLGLFLCGAPVPTHLMPPPPPDPIRPGYCWMYQRWVLRVTRVEGETVWYQVVNDPKQEFGSLVPGVCGPNVEPRETVRREAALYGEPPAWMMGP